MRENQTTETVTPADLVGKVREFADANWRLVQICVTRLPEGFELNYTFDKEYAFRNLRLSIPVEVPVLPSVSGVYWNAFLYENEMHDLFGITFEGLVLDFKGTLYKTAKPFAFNEIPVACAAKSAPANPAAPAAG